MPKQLPCTYRADLRLRLVQDSKLASSLEITTETGQRFCIKLRQSVQDPFDFSAILAYHLPGSTKVFRLRRYNGDHGEHTNHLERLSFEGPHVHYATERYQAVCPKEDSYAVVCDRYDDLHGALECLLEDCGFVRPETDPPRLL